MSEDRDWTPERCSFTLPNGLRCAHTTSGHDCPARNLSAEEAWGLLAEARKEADGLRQELSELHTKHDALKKAWTDKATACDKLRAKLADAERIKESLRSILSSTEAVVNDYDEREVALQAKLDTVTAQRDECTKELHRLAKATGVPDDGPTEIVGEVLAKLAEAEEKPNQDIPLEWSKMLAEVDAILGTRGIENTADAARRVVAELSETKELLDDAHSAAQEFNREAEDWRTVALALAERKP